MNVEPIARSPAQVVNGGEIMKSIAWLQDQLVRQSVVEWPTWAKITSEVAIDLLPAGASLAHSQPRVWFS